MVCSIHLRTLILQAGSIQKATTQGSVRFANLGRRSWLGISVPRYNTDRIFPSIRKMMVDISAAGGRGLSNDALSGKDGDDGYASGGWKSDDGKMSCGYSSFRGKRASMEDFFDVKTCKINEQTVCLFGIFDGHGGSRAAEYLKENLFKNLMNHPKFFTETRMAISETYLQTDSDFLDTGKDMFRDDGSTASTAVLVGNHLYVANVGDSRTVLSKAGKAIPLSDDHKPNRSDERKRVENAGGVVMWAGTWRVGGVLAMSRAFGNRMLKQFVVAEPEIQEQELDEEFELLVLASDGLWDVVPNEDAISIALLEEEPKSAARKLVETAFSRGSADNITCIVVRFYHELASRSQTQPQSKTEVELQAQAEPEVKTESQITTEPETIPEPQITTEPESKPEPQITTELATKTEPQITIEPETKGEPQMIETKPDQITTEPETRT